MRHPICAYSILLTLLSGCGANRAVVLPWDYAPPSPVRFWNDAPVEKMAAARAAKMQKAEPPEIPQQKEPITLGELIDVALRNNTKTRQTWALARQAAAEYAQSQQDLFPAVTGSFAFQRTRSLGTAVSGAATPTPDSSAASVVDISAGGPLASIPIYQSEWGPQLSISYLIFDFGQTRVSSEGALMALYNANLTHNREIQTVVQLITTDCYNYLYQKKLLDSYEDDIHDAKVTLEAANTSLKAGVKSVSDVLQARSQLLQVETDWINQKQTAQAAYTQLLTDMGVPATMEFCLENMPEDPPVYKIMSSVNELISLALEARSDLIAAEADLISKEKRLKAAKLNMFPTISGVFDVGKTFFNGGINDGYDFTAQLAASWSLFNGFFDLSSIRLAQAQKEQSKAALRQTELQVIEDITNAHFNVAVARDALKYTTDYLKAALEDYRVALRQYEVGTTTILSVTNAQSRLADARAKKANALQQWFVSLSTLGYATGVMEQDLGPYIRGEM